MDPDLYNAARLGDVRFLGKEVIKTRNLLSQVTPRGNSVLHIAAESNQLEFFQEATRLWSPLLVKQANSKGDTPLHFAVRAGSTKIVKFIIEHAKKLPSDLDEDIEEGQDHVEGYKEMLRMANLDGDNALHLAARYNKKSTLARLLIEADPQLSTIPNNESNQSACFIAIANRNKYVAGLLLSRSNPSCSLSGEINGMTALHVAIVAFAKGSGYLVSIIHQILHNSTKLLEEGLDPFEMMGELELLSKIVNAAPNMIKQGDDKGWTPLHYAAYFNSIRAVKLILKKDRSAAYILDKQDGLSALHIAASVGEVGSMKALLAACPDCVELVDNRGRNALHAAFLSGKEYVVKFMLRRISGSLFFEADKDGKTPLHLDTLHRKKGNIITAVDAKKAFRLSFSDEHEIFDIQDEQQQATEYVKDALNEEPIAPPITDASSDYGYLQFSATLIATVTFTAAFTIPGGFIQSGTNKDEGMAVLKSKPAFQAFVIFDVLAFFASFSIVVLLLLFNKSQDKNLRRRIVTAVGMYLVTAYYGMALAFTCGLYVVLGNISGFSVVVLVLSVMGTLVAISGFFFIQNPYLIYSKWSEFEDLFRRRMKLLMTPIMFIVNRRKKDADDKAS